MSDRRAGGLRLGEAVSEAALQCWLEYEKRLALHRSWQEPFISSQLPDPRSFRSPTVTLTREALMQFRADYALALALLSECVGRDVAHKTPAEVIRDLVERAWADLRKGDQP